MSQYAGVAVHEQCCVVQLNEGNVYVEKCGTQTVRARNVYVLRFHVGYPALYLCNVEVKFSYRFRSEGSN